MRAFVAGDADVLVSTTIIESGLDIPNANTIVIDRADLFGLADLYQLQGRVGRSETKAYAYLMLPRDLMGTARKRVSAIKQYSDLGPALKSPCAILKSAGLATCSARRKAGHRGRFRSLLQASQTGCGNSLREVSQAQAARRTSPRFPLYRSAMEPRAQ